MQLTAPSPYTMVLLALAIDQALRTLRTKDLDLLQRWNAWAEAQAVHYPDGTARSFFAALFICDFCLSHWLSLGFFLSWALAARQTWDYGSWLMAPVYILALIRLRTLVRLAYSKLGEADAD